MLKFNELFKVLFGVKGKFPAFVSRDCMIEFTTPGYDLIDVRFQRGIWAWLTDRKAVFQIMENNKLLYEENRSISMFSNESGFDPKKYPGVGKRKIRGTERFTALKPNTTYVLRQSSRKSQRITYVGLF
jgi:hypothetical protein